MKTFRFLMMSVATIVLAGFMSCNNNDDILSNGENDNEAFGDAYFSINLSIPNDASSNAPAFRAPAADPVEDSGTKEAGTADEVAVNRVDLYFFQGTTYVSTISFETSASEIAGTTSQGNKQLVTSVVKKVNLARGATYQVYALVNHALVTGVTSPTALLNAPLTPVATVSNGFVTLVATNGLPMAGRTVDTATGDRVPPVEITIAANNSITSPAILQFDAERSVAKLLLTEGAPGAPANTYDITDGAASPTKIATGVLENYAVVNLMNTGFAFRHAAPEADIFSSFTYSYGDIEDNKHYIMDPQTHNKTIAGLTGLSLTTLYSQHVSDTRVYAAAPATKGENKIIGYSYENTTGQAEQKNGYSTGLVFKVKIMPEKVTYLDGGTATEGTPTEAGLSPTSTFYFYGGKFYVDIDALEAKLGVDLTSDPALSDPSELKKLYSVETLTDGYCYYNYWIKHYDDGSLNTMGVMEFGIVRNNLYKMKVTGISGIGSGIDEIIPEEDDETPLAYLKVEMSILPWIVRSNENIVL